MIPDYQRPYSWERDECRTLWDNLYEFAFPDENDIKNFDKDEEVYFMGTILTFKNSSKEYEVIDGQQRLVTFMLILRAFYEEFGSAQEENIKLVRRKIEQCLWHVDEDEKPDKDSLKLKYAVITDEDASEFKKILKLGEPTPKIKSNFDRNYRLFKRWIEDLNRTKQGHLIYLARRILNNVIILPIEADTENTALRIFTTLNDSGRPLSSSDIFKAQFYKFYSQIGSTEKKCFIERWRNLEELCKKIFHPTRETPLEDLFRRYMYYLVAIDESKKSVRKDLRDYYERDGYKILHNDKTFSELELLLKFWDDVAIRNEERFSPRVLRQLYILSWTSSIWAYVVSIYFMGNREFDEENFYHFLNKITAMLLLYAVIHSALQTIWQPFFPEFKNILYARPIEFKNFKQDEKILRDRLKITNFSNQRAITGAMLAWWTFTDPAQELPPPGVELQIEHILPKKRQELHQMLRNPDALEFLGNKSLLEKGINIRAADYRLSDKRIFYQKSFNFELQRLAETHDDFTERDIIERNERIFEAFIEFLRGQDLLL